VGFYSGALLVFFMKESKKRRRKQPNKLMAKSHSQPVNLPGARPLMNSLQSNKFLKGVKIKTTVIDQFLTKISKKISQIG